MIYNTKIDLVNDNVYTKFGLNLSVGSQNIEHYARMTERERDRQNDRQGNSGIALMFSKRGYKYYSQIYINCINKFLNSILYNNN